MPTDRTPAGCALRRGLPAVFILLVLTGCNPARIEAQNEYRGPSLARPDRVLVSGFTVAAQEIQLDQGVRARLTRMMGHASPGQQRVQIAQLVDSTMTDELVRKLRSYGIAAEQGAGPGPDSDSSTVTVEGQVAGIDEGNRTRRTLVGFGAGKSSFEAGVQLYYLQGTAQPRLLESFRGTADSGHAPGAAATMGVGGAAGSSVATSALASAGMHGMSERRAATPEDLARKTADALAEHIGEFFISQGWLPHGAVQ